VKTLTLWSSCCFITKKKHQSSLDLLSANDIIILLLPTDLIILKISKINKGTFHCHPHILKITRCVILLFQHYPACLNSLCRFTFRMVSYLYISLNCNNTGSKFAKCSWPRKSENCLCALNNMRLWCFDHARPWRIRTTDVGCRNAVLGLLSIIWISWIKVRIILF
jgi:hypothetical protein